MPGHWIPNRTTRVQRQNNYPAAAEGTVLSGVSFTQSGSMAYRSAAADIQGAGIKTARVRFRVKSMPTTGIYIIAGNNNGGSANGWLLCIDDPISGQAVRQVAAYVGNGSALTLVGTKFLMPADIGKVFTAYIVTDGTRGKFYLDAEAVGLGNTAAATMGTSTYNLVIGGRADGTISSDSVVYDVSEGTTAITRADMLDDFVKPIPAYPGLLHSYVATPELGATWTDLVGSQNLTRVGSPVVATGTVTFGNHKGPVDIMGDSIAAGRIAGGLLSDGWKREVERYVSTTGKCFTFCGNYRAANATPDFDRGVSAVGGESLNTRLATLAAYMAGNAPAESATIMAWGVNDIVALDRTAVQLQADVATAVGIINTERPGRPILVCTVLQVASTAASAAERAEIAAYQAAFPGMIASLRVTYPNVVGIDYASVVTNPDDTAQLFDGTHPAPAIYSAQAGVIGPVIAANL